MQNRHNNCTNRHNYTGRSCHNSHASLLEARINAELDEYAYFVENDGILFIHIVRAGFMRPDWETATHTLIEQNGNRIVVETRVLMRSGEGDAYSTFRFTFIGGRINVGPGAWAK